MRLSYFVYGAFNATRSACLGLCEVETADAGHLFVAGFNIFISTHADNHLAFAGTFHPFAGLLEGPFSDWFETAFHGVWITR